MSATTTSPPSEPIWLTTEQQRSWRAYLEGSARLNEALAADSEEHSTLSLSEYEILVRLSEAPEWTMRMSELADGLAHSRSRVTHTVRRMEDRGLVLRRSCAKDGRGVNCVMQPEGHRELVAAAPWHVSAVRRYLVDVLTADELALLGDVMARVAAATRS